MKATAKPLLFAMLVFLTACGDDDSGGEDDAIGTTSRGSSGTDGESLESTTGGTATTTDDDASGSTTCPAEPQCDPERQDECEMGFYCNAGCCEPIPM